MISEITDWLKKAREFVGSWGPWEWAGVIVWLAMWALYCPDRRGSRTPTRTAGKGNTHVCIPFFWRVRCYGSLTTKKAALADALTPTRT